MAFLSMRHDFRAPAFAPESLPEIYATALEQFAWADQHGFDSLVLSEHHGVDDGWMPAPLTMAAAVLARTAKARLMISAAILPNGATSMMAVTTIDRTISSSTSG